MESLDDASEAEPCLDEIDADPELLLLEKEPDSWVDTVDKEIVSGLTEKQVKKQAAIYELIITEKHHCRLLKVMQKVFADGMSKELGMEEWQIKRIFPCLDELLTIHCSFLWRLRQLQRHNRYIDTVGPLLLDQFTGDNAQGLKDAYGFICSQQQDGVSYYKDILKTDRRFQNFIKLKSLHPLLEKKGVQEVIIFISQRVTKYPLTMSAIMKYSKDQPDEAALISKALNHVKEILVNINSQVARKEREQRILEIYHRIDAKSSIPYKTYKIKKSDLICNNRKLKFEGSAILTQQKGKSLLVQVVVMSDFVFFLHENNQKYNFVYSDNKAGAIPLDKLILREKAGENSRAIYLIHSKSEAEMFEFECQQPKDKKIWLSSIKDAIDECPEEGELTESSSKSRVQELDNERIRELLAKMQQKDQELAGVLEEKSSAMTALLDCLDNDEEVTNPAYRAMLDENSLTFTDAKDLQISSLQEAIRLVSTASGLGTNLARSVSSVGEHQSEAYVSPSLPKRAETFGGFDNPIKDNKDPSKQSGKKKKDSRLSLTSASTTDASDFTDSSLKHRRPSGSSSAARSSQDNVSMSTLSTDGSVSSQQQQQQQQVACTKLLNCLQTALVLSHHHLTQYEILRCKAVTGTGPSVDGRFRHSQKLEELRNLQEAISHERAQWVKEKDAQDCWVAEKTADLKKLQDSLREQQKDIFQQRDDLYRKLETLQHQGISLSPGMTVITTHPTQQQQFEDIIGGDTNIGQSSPHNSPTCTVPSQRSRDKHRNSTVSLTAAKRDSNPSLPTHLISNTSQHKSSSIIKQQLPMKLAKLGTAGSSSSSSSSMSSSLTSSMSTGGSMSPSQEQQTTTQRSHSSAGLFGGTQQMLPLKLSENTLERSSRGIPSTQRLASSPPTTGDSSIAAHQRTGSSPASLQNGSPTSQATGVTSTSPYSGAQSNPRAVRTNTYPKISSKPTITATRAASEASRNKEASSIDLGSNTRPGQRVKDPESNQDIIFF